MEIYPLVGLKKSIPIYPNQYSMYCAAILEPQNGSRQGTRRREPHAKVRTGCTICKQRRVKCDEGKPSCHRCIRSSKQCVYQNSERSGNTRQPLAPKSNAVALYPAFSKSLNGSMFQNEREYQCFQTFCKKTVFSLAGFEEPYVWNQLVLQACDSQESIRYTVIALGALDKTLEAAQIEQRQPSFDLRRLHDDVTSSHQFALQQYGKAVKKTREELGSGKQDLRTTLISCLLFVAFELFHGNHTSALAQGCLGLKMIVERMKELRKQSPNSALGIGYLFSSIEEVLIQQFVRLDISSKSFVDETVMRDYDTSESETFDYLEVIPDVFTSLGEAQRYWELSMRRTTDFMGLTESWKRDSQDHAQISITAQRIHVGEAEWKVVEQIPKSAKDHGQTRKTIRTESSASLQTENLHIQRALAWSSAFHPLFQHSRTPEGKKDFVRATLLQIRSKTTLIAALLSSPEGGQQFDNPTHLYQEVLDLAESISGSHFGSRKASFTFDAGLICPLFIVATRCRDCVMRRKAIKLLLANPKRECFWDNIVAAKFATVVMVLEERGLRDGFVPESARIKIQGISFDLLESRGMLRYSRGKWRPLEERVVECIEVTW